MMRRTQIQLDEKDYVELERLAAGQGRSMADCVREGIRLFLERSRAAEADLRPIAGKFRPGPLEDLKEHDRWVVEAIERRSTRRP